MMDNTSEARLALVYPRLASLIRELHDRLSASDIRIVVVQGLRTVSQQDLLYAQGRTRPGHIVTNARGGQSYHNYGLAVDCAPMVGTVIDWNAQHPAWKAMEDAGVALGLTSGATWQRIVDAPHFQLTGPWPVGSPSDAVRQLYAAQGLPGLWAELDAYYAGQETASPSPSTTRAASPSPPEDTPGES